MVEDIYEVLNEWLKEVVPDYRFGGIAFNRRAVFNEGERFPDHYVLDIYTDVPGFLIGKAGSVIDKYKKELAERVRSYNITEVNIFEVSGFVIKPRDKKKMKKYFRQAKRRWFFS